MCKDMREERIERKCILLSRDEDNARNGDQGLVELGLLNVLEHNAFRALFFYHTFIVWKIKGRGLDPAIAITRSEHFIDDTDWRCRSEPGVAVSSVDGKVIFQFLKITAELCQPGRFGIVTKCYIGFERGLITKQFVFVCFIWPERNVNRRVEIHPRNITLVIIVRQKRVSAICKKSPERLI